MCTARAWIKHLQHLLAKIHCSISLKTAVLYVEYADAPCKVTQIQHNNLIKLQTYKPISVKAFLTHDLQMNLPTMEFQVELPKNI